MWWDTSVSEERAASSSGWKRYRTVLRDVSILPHQHAASQPRRPPLELIPSLSCSSSLLSAPSWLRWLSTWTSLSFCLLSKLTEIVKPPRDEGCQSVALSSFSFSTCLSWLIHMAELKGWLTYTKLLFPQDSEYVTREGKS